MDNKNVSLDIVIRANNDEFERNVGQRNPRALAQAFYAENAVLMPPDQPMISGRPRITEFWDQMFEAGLRGAKLKTLQVETSGDLACEIGAYALTMGGKGAETTEAVGKYLVVLHRQADGSWKATADIFNGNGS